MITRSCSFLVAATIAVIDVAMIAPAQAAFMPSASVIAAAKVSDDVVQVHRRYRRYPRYHYQPYAYQPYIYAPYPYVYYAPRYYPRYYQPGVSLRFKFGGGHRYHGW
jgi:hypothetical protein